MTTLRADPRIVITQTATRVWWLWVVGALLVGLAARVPGVLWGENFPGGWRGHHPDEWTHIVNAETLIDPYSTPRWRLHPYPMGMAAPVAAPYLVKALLQEPRIQRPAVRTTAILGRSISVIHGVATILVCALIARGLFRDSRVGLVAAWVMALGGLHVSQSHFFVADVSGLFWLLVGLHLLLVHLQHGGDTLDLECFRWAAFAFGIAFGLKLIVIGMPTLAAIALSGGYRIRKIVHAAVFFVAGFVAINLASFSPRDLMQVLDRGAGDPYVFDRWKGLLLYLVELPRLVSFPVAILSIVGAGWLLGKRLRALSLRRRRALALIVGLPVLAHGVLVFAKFDHFPRHLVPLIPWMAMAAGWALVALGDRLRQSSGLRPEYLFAAFFLYLGLFVFDGERVFWRDPRNRAARWMEQNVEPGTTTWWQRHEGFNNTESRRYPAKGEPAVLVMEMLDANHYLSGVDWRDSDPQDRRAVHGALGPGELEALQGVFRGTSGYAELARFKEGYFMPEFVIADRLIGNRSGNYVCEIVVFAKQRGVGG